jgi:3-dehydroquinate dehydratase/shikimate dehydrogenase
VTLVCVPIMVHEVDTALADALAAKQVGADLVEFRVDGFFAGNGHEEEMRCVLRLVRESPLPVIVTCRSREEGGMYDGPLDAKVALYEYLGRSTDPPRYLDLELAEYERSANMRHKMHLAIDYPARRGSPSSLIMSVHDTRGRPSDLARRVARIVTDRAVSVLKVAYKARSLRDNLELLELCKATRVPTIALGMGEFGVMSRVLAPKFGGFLTFASLSARSATAAGQPTVRELLDLYRFRAIGTATQVFGIIGWPLQHSLSPHVHNTAFGSSGYDGVYLPLPIAPGSDGDETYASLKATLLDLVEHPRLGFAGASVTLPFKEHLARLAQEQGWEMDEATSEAGAGNTLKVERDSNGGVRSVSVHNTDARAVVNALKEAGVALNGMKVALLGSGGAARSAAWALAHEGAEIVMYVRNTDTAQRRTRALEAGIKAWNTLEHAEFDVCINCTPVGMRGSSSGCPLPSQAITRMGAHHTVMDMVYNPRETMLIAAARRRGALVVPGEEMFLRQARAQFQIWTGRTVPEAVFRSAFEHAMGEDPTRSRG